MKTRIINLHGARRILLVLVMALVMMTVAPLAGMSAVYAQETQAAEATRATAENTVDAARHANTVVYVVKRGDVLSVIAQRHTITLRGLLALNPQIRNPDRLFVGQRINVPAVAQQPQPQPPADFTRTKIFLVSLDDGGSTGMPIGCNDSLVPVTVDIAPTRAILRGSLERLLSLDSAYYGESGLYTALYQSDLAIKDVRIVNRVAIIELTGTLQVGGVCDVPRVKAQLEQIALQFSTVDAVQVTVNGKSLAEVLQQ